ncbi:MAG: DAK2 domain-containing protein, partial [Oscillospiraceae bacterium]|nr:DAK2 domain-containing protein [Oscillospiraceae bacterium]
MAELITGSLYKKMIISAAADIENNKEPINDLNVFPVPDGDTGTNMSLTMSSGAAELSKAEFTSIGRVAEVAANAFLRGARGNSGVILSLLFRGMSKYLKDKESATTAEFAAAMQEGVKAAYKAVMKPAEGTILTVSRVTSKAAVKIAGKESDPEKFFEALIPVASDALANTINQNPVLEKAGVIDAGGKGYLCILEGMYLAVSGKPVDMPVVKAESSNMVADVSDFDADSIFTYCTEFIVSRSNTKSTDVLGDYLNGIGDSIVMVDDDELIKVHVHTNDPGDVLSHALAYGSFMSVKIENMKLQHTQTKFAAAKQKPSKKYGFVVVSAGEGLKSIFKDLGADRIVSG